MDLFERVKLLVRSTLSGGLPDFSSAGGDPQRMLDTAEAKLDILRDDLARAEKKGNDELAGTLKTEIAGLEKLIAKARGKAQQASANTPAQPAEAAATTPAIEPAKAETPGAIEKPIAETPRETEKPADVVIDETRVADQLKKLREEK
jgi:hypothetical protein